MSKLSVFGTRVAVIGIDEEFESEIAMPRSRNLSYQIGRVYAVGNGRVNGEVQDMIVKEKEIVLYQLNMIQEQNQRYMHDSLAVHVIHAGDLIARLKSNVVKMENFEILGAWVLVEPFIKKLESNIVLPDTAIEQSEWQRYKLVQAGCNVKHPMTVGQELIVERMMVQPIIIDKKRYGFVSGDRIHGVVETTSGEVIVTTE